MSTTRWIIETPCQHESMDAHIYDSDQWVPDSVPGWEVQVKAQCPGGARIVVDPDNLPPEAIQRAAKAWAAHERDDWNSLGMTQQYELAATAKVIVTAFLSDPEPGDQP